MLLLAGMGPPGGGRTVISPRLQSRFNLVNMTFPSVGSSSFRFLRFEFLFYRQRKFVEFLVR
jgi:hypothetical protein